MRHIRMNKALLFALLLFNAQKGFAQVEKPETVVRRVADNIVKNTSFTYVNKESGQTYPSTKDLDYSPLIKSESPYNQWEYWNGVLNIGMVELGKRLKDPSYIEYSKKNFDFIFSGLSFFNRQYKENVKGSSYYQYFRLNKLDDCGAMAAALADVKGFDNRKEYTDYLNRIGDYMLNKVERLNDDTFCRPGPRKMTIWADDLYMSVPFLARMGKITGEKKYFDLAIKQVENFSKYLLNPATGMYFHCWYSDVKMNGVAQWGRCNGWVLVATTELLNNLPANHPKRAELTKVLLNHIVSVSRYQDKSGLWHQVLDKPDSYLETSCSAMFIYSVARAVNQGWIDKSYGNIATQGWKGLSTKIQPDGQVQDICIGTGISNDINFYYERPTKLNDIHGLGIVILAGTEMIDLQK